MKVYFSHTGYNSLLPEIEVKGNTLIELIDNLNQIDCYVGIKNRICTSAKINSGARIFADIDISCIHNIGELKCYKYYEKNSTVELYDLHTNLHTYENILITLFDPKILLDALNEAQSDDTEPFSFTNENGSIKSKNYKPILEEINFDTDIIDEAIFEFKNGECSLSSLAAKHSDSLKVELKGEDFDKYNSKLLPEDLVGAIRDIWEIPQGEGKLRLFQEDSLFFIMSKLLKTKYPKEEQLLLSMPTGGGKTEAFMIPIIANIYQKKVLNGVGGVKSIIIYPTNALANDQAMRFVELIYKVNSRLFTAGIPKNNYLSVGVLSGDTPSSNRDLANESLIKICPKCGKSDHWKAENDTLICYNELSDGTLCGTRLDFCRLTKSDIVNNPPDILITNPDEINFALHSPKYLSIFKSKTGSKIDSIVFDEVHIYQGVFGCHISHLLRRLEESIGYKPLYIGMSATIGNAKELAALLFDEPIDNIKYIRNENGRYVTDNVTKIRKHILIKPYLRDTIRTSSGEEKNKYVRTMSVAGAVGMFIGHMIADSHFRKSIIFTNYRSEADDLAGYLQERQRLDVKVYFEEIIEKLKNKMPLTQEEIEICEFMNKWFEVIIDKLGTVNNSLQIGWNRGGLEKEERIRSVHSFTRNNILAEAKHERFPIDLMVATKSLEVGIDIGDVTTVINASAPFTINEYVQRVGRAGRKKDSLAVTVINPENAIDSHMRKHFKEYVKPTINSFEDAPIIINNEIIVQKHVVARMVDVLTSLFVEQIGENSLLLTVRDLEKRVNINHKGERVFLGEGCSKEQEQKYAEALYHEMFNRTVNGERVVDRFFNYLKREHLIINTKECTLTELDFKEWVIEIVRKWNENIAKKKWQADKNLAGYSSVMPELTPSLRGAGANVSLYIGDNDSAVDIVTRQKAFMSMPISSGSVSTTKSGVSSFMIKDDKGESDESAEGKIKRALSENFPNSKIFEFFKSKLIDFPDVEDVIDFLSRFNVLVPSNLRTAYFPSRFYCPTCKKGLIPKDDTFEKKNGIYCRTCQTKAQQLHKLYMCEDDECGQLDDPAIPRMCINPKCTTVKKAYQMYVSNGYRHKPDIFNLFKFRLTKDLTWVCQSCGCKIDFASWRKLLSANNKNIQDSISPLRGVDKKSIEGMCSHSIWNPEIYKDNNEALYRCSNIREHKNRKAIGTPRVRTVAYNFVKDSDYVLCKQIENPIVSLKFKKGSVIQLAKEFTRRFSSGVDSESYTMKTEKIFHNKFWGNYYESHLAWIKFGDQIDRFLRDEDIGCDGNCARCKNFETDKLDLGKMMKPRTILEDFNFDSVNEKPKKPDYRGKFCDKAVCNSCNQQWCVKIDTLDVCPNFDRKSFLRYLIVHTLKHAILWALPKYAGVNVSEIKGEVYPNDDKQIADLVFIDSNEGGSGSILLIEKHWDEIWEFAKEIVELTAKNEANIILPHTCSRYNSDLCPFVTNQYIKYLNRQ